MAREKQHVFSARTTAEGLKALNEVKTKLGVNWDDLVIDAVSTRYELEKAMMTVPKKGKPVKEAQPAEQSHDEETATEQPAATEQERPTKGKRTAKKRKKGGKKASTVEAKG